MNPAQSSQYAGQYTGGMQPQATGYNQPQGMAYGQAQNAYNSQAQQSIAPQQTGYNGQSSAYNNQPSYQSLQNNNQPYMNPMQSQRTGGPQGFSGFGGMAQNQTGFSGFSNQNAAPQEQPLFHPMQQQPFVPQQTASAPAAPRLKQQKTGANIPSSRLSFVQANDQQKFEDLFAKAVGPYNTALPGDEAKTILMKSGLPANQLSKIWALSDTTRSGQLLFPEFVLAMHLCNTAIRKGSVPDRLDERVKNEVSSMVDHIAFTAADTAAAPSAQPTTSAPNFNAPQQAQQLSNVSLMAQQMQPAQMGFYNYNQPLQSQMTGYQPQIQAQMTGYQPQLHAQMTGYNPAQQTYQNGYQPGQGIQPGLTGVQQPGATGVGFLQPQQTQQANLGYNQTQQTGAFQFPMQPLTTQPTGKPGEWGFVRAPQGSVQGMQALGAAMMPGATSNQGSFQMPQQQQNIEVTWAITKEEKQIYDTIFKAWDKKGQGFVDGPVAIEVFGSSGVSRQDLELIWALADSDDKGKLNSDEFAVALHLIYRRLNGYEVPPVLPPELIPPSTRNFGDSISQVKNMLQQDASARNGPTSYMKSRSFKDTNTNRDYSKDGTVYKHNDADVGYVSSSRRRAPGSAPESVKTPSSAPSEASTASISGLRKLIKEKQVLLDAIDQRDESRPDEDFKLNQQARKDADDLFRQIRKVQSRLDSHHNKHLLEGDDSREKSNLQRQLQSLVDRLPEIASQVRSVERRVQEVQLEIWTKQDKNSHPGTATLVGTGPGGQVTEADKRRAKTRAMMAARTAALTGKPAPSSNEDDLEAATRRQAEKAAEFTKTREGNEQMIRDIEESAESLRKDIESALGSSHAISVSEHERRRWDDAVGVEPEVRDFIRDLNHGRASSQSVRSMAPEDKEMNQSMSSLPSVTAQREPPSRSSTPTYRSFNGAEDRAAYLKQAAEARMAERLAALGIRTKKKATRDAPSSVPVTNSEIIAEADDQAREQVLREEQVQQAKERQALEEKTKQEEAALLDAQRRQDADLKRVAQEKAAGDLRNDEARKQQQAAMKPVDSRQAKLAQLRAEREARLAEEERLERELAEAEASSSSEPDLSPPSIETNPFSKMKTNPEQSQFVPPPTAPETQTPKVMQSSNHFESEAQTDSTNPFYKFGQQNAPVTQSPASIRPPSAGPPSTQRINAPRSKPVRKHSDDWSVESKEDESSSDEDGPSPADLAARLFSGGMQPQRTGVQTPIAAQRTGAANSPAPIMATTARKTLY